MKYLINGMSGTRFSSQETISTCQDIKEIQVFDKHRCLRLQPHVSLHGRDGRTGHLRKWGNSKDTALSAGQLHGARCIHHSSWPYLAINPIPNRRQVTGLREPAQEFKQRFPVGLSPHCTKTRQIVNRQCIDVPAKLTPVSNKLEHAPWYSWLSRYVNWPPWSRGMNMLVYLKVKEYDEAY